MAIKSAAITANKTTTTTKVYQLIPKLSMFNIKNQLNTAEDRSRAAHVLAALLAVNCHNLRVSSGTYHRPILARAPVMSDIGNPDHIEHSARVQAAHYRETAAQFRAMADIEPLASVRRHLRWLAAQYDEMAAELDTPQAGPTIAAD